MIEVAEISSQGFLFYSPHRPLEILIKSRCPFLGSFFCSYNYTFDLKTKTQEKKIAGVEYFKTTSKHSLLFCFITNILNLNFFIFVPVYF